MKRYLAVALLSLLLWSCKKTVQQTGVPGKWKITSDIIYRSVNSGAQQPIPISLKYSPYYQFNNDGTGAYMRDTTGAGGVTGFTYRLSRDSSTTSVYQPTIQITVPNQVVDGVEIGGTYQIADIAQVNSQVLSISFFTTYIIGSDMTTDIEWIKMARVN